MTVPLHYRQYGHGGRFALVLVHGLLGRWTNWHALARPLACRGSVYALDLRNHGDSPHCPSMTYAEMREDLKDWMDARGLDAAFLLGHSMGGNVVMDFACRYPGRVKGLVVLDVKPAAIPRTLPVLKAMASVELARFSRPDDVIDNFVQKGTTRELATFVCSNLRRTPRGKLEWRVNLPVMLRFEKHVMSFSLQKGDRYDGPVEMLLGGRSKVVLPVDYPPARKFLPRARFEIIPGAGHNLHVEQPERVRERVWRFLLANSAAHGA